MITVFSTSLNPNSRSRILANTAGLALERLGEPNKIVDLFELPLPFCDADKCYADPNAAYCRQLIRDSKAILLATPIYNFDVSSSAKNLVELTGDAWREKVVGFLAAAGGMGSYMSVMGLANSLMLDFRTIVVPRFVFASENAFRDGVLNDPEIERRTVELATQTAWIANALTGR